MEERIKCIGINIHMLIKEVIEQPITQNDLRILENYLDKIFGTVDIDVDLMKRHFLDRVNDYRNNKQITIEELRTLFQNAYAQYGKSRKISQLGPGAEAVIKDMQTNINIPFVLDWDRENQELDLIAKSVMRKRNFHTSNTEFRV